MRCDFSIVGVLARTELRMVLRDPRVLVTGLLLPALAMPLLIFSSTWGLQKREQRLKEITCQYAVAGSEAAWARSLIESGLKSANSAATNQQARFNCHEVAVTNGIGALNDAAIHVLVTALSPDEAARESGTAKKRGGIKADNEIISGARLLRLTWRADREESTAAMSRVKELLEQTRDDQRTRILADAGLPAPRKALRIESRDLAPPTMVAGAALGRGLTLLLLVFVLSGGAIVALDTLAGEKERGSLETLLVSGARRPEIIASKLIAVSVIGLAVAVAQVASALLFSSLKVIVLPVNISAALNPVAMAGLIIVYLPLVALIAAILLLLSGRARSYKEAQLNFIPVMFVCLAPAVAPLLPSLSLRSIMALVPIANTALSAREIMSGNFDWPFLALAWVSTAGAAVWTARLALASVSEERFVMPAAEDTAQPGSPSLFGRHVLVWFAVIWAMLLVVSSYFQKADIRVQLFVNLVVFLLGGSLLMIWRYKLPVRETLSLRMPPAAAWFAVLCGVPGGMLTATGLFRLISYVAPVPREMVEAFSEEIIPKNMTAAGLFLFLAILPGIIEELTFRGVLLHGLRKRMGPVAVVLVVGAVFGLFHMALFRFAPTFALGVCLAITTLLTRSIYPAMLWHALNNGLGVWTAQNHILLGELEPQYYLPGVAALAVSFWVLWRNRVPQSEPSTSKRT